MRILQVVNDMHRAGLETMLMNYYRNIDRTKIQFDFLTHRPYKSDYDDEILSLGGRMYYAPRLYPQNYIQYFRWMDKFFEEHLEYQIMHSHIDSMSYLPLLAAKRANVPVRIAHSHNTSIDRDLKYPLKQLFRTRITKVANEYCACGEEAGKFLFGNRDFKVIPNAIETERFIYKEEVRKRVRKLKDVVLGHYLVKDAKEILNFANYKLPAHIELGEEIIIDTEVESLKLQEALMEAVSEKDYLYFSPRFQTKEKDFMCKCISGGMSRCKDGTLSNVLGASLAQKRRRYIGVVTEEEFLHDMNTLGNIHANKDLFFIVISQKFEKMIGDYARTLNYEVICEAEDNICGTSLKRLFENGKQTIFIMLKK